MVIETKNLTKVYKRYRRSLIALDSLNLKIKKGVVFGLLGPNGSGKSTLLKLLLGLIFPTSGSIRILGEPPTAFWVRRRIGFVPENPHFYSFLKAPELLDFYGKLNGVDGAVRQKRKEALLERMGLGDSRRMLLSEFSRGMLQRIGIAAALMNDPELLLLDEPILGLDPIGIHEISGLIKQLKAEGKTIVLASHMLSEVEESCDEVAILDRGKLLLYGELKGLLAARSLKDVFLETVEPRPAKGAGRNPALYHYGIGRG